MRVKNIMSGELILLACVVGVIVITACLAYLSNRSVKHRESSVPAEADSLAEEMENIENADGESLYAFTLTVSRKVCPCCECENPPSAVYCEACGAAI